MGDQAVIQVRYLDMAMNMHDIVHLTAKWQKGNDGARAELGEPTRRTVTRGRLDRQASELVRGPAVVRGPRGG